jgi:hypothetical protein
MRKKERNKGLDDNDFFAHKKRENMSSWGNSLFEHKLQDDVPLRPFDHSIFSEFLSLMILWCISASSTSLLSLNLSHFVLTL